MEHTALSLPESPTRPRRAEEVVGDEPIALPAAQRKVGSSDSYPFEGQLFENPPDGEVPLSCAQRRAPLIPAEASDASTHAVPPPSPTTALTNVAPLPDCSLKPLLVPCVRVPDAVTLVSSTAAAGPVAP